MRQRKPPVSFEHMAREQLAAIQARLAWLEAEHDALMLMKKGAEGWLNFRQKMVLDTPEPLFYPEPPQ